jgi:hypothetical protein
MEASRAASDEDMTGLVRALAAAGGPGLLLRRAGPGAGGSTCLYAAAAAGNLGAVRCLLAAGGPILLACRRHAEAGGGTCLHAAAAAGHLRVAAALCAAAAAELPASLAARLLRVRDCSGRTAWDVAQEKKHAAVARVLHDAAVEAAAASAAAAFFLPHPSPSPEPALALSLTAPYCDASQGQRSLGEPKGIGGGLRSVSDPAVGRI